MAKHPTSDALLQPRSSAHVDRLRVRHLRLLALIATHGSLTAAGDALHISQPSVTKMLQELEHALGCTLVQRNVRGGTLSAAGLRALERLRVALGSLDAATQALASQPDRPLLRVGMLPLAGMSLIPQALELLSARGIRPRLELREGSVLAMSSKLCAGEVDCVVGRVADAHVHGVGRFDILPLQDEGFVVACSPTHPLAQKRGVTLAQLQGEGWIALPHGSYTRQVFDAAFISLGLEPPVPEVLSPSLHSSLAIAASTELLVFAPRSAVSLYQGNKRLQRVSLAQPFPSEFSAFLTLRGVPQLPAVVDLRMALTEVTR